MVINVIMVMKKTDGYWIIFIIDVTTDYPQFKCCEKKITRKNIFILRVLEMMSCDFLKISIMF
jgi:hypothetical protein